MNLSTLWSPETSGTKRSGLSMVIVSSKSERGLSIALGKGSNPKPEQPPYGNSIIAACKVTSTRIFGLVNAA